MVRRIAVAPFQDDGPILGHAVTGERETDTEEQGETHNHVTLHDSSSF
jgi:hypothetical protein